MVNEPVDRVTAEWRVLVIHRQKRLIDAEQGKRPRPADMTEDQCRQLLDRIAFSYWRDARDAGLVEGDDPC